MKKSPWHVVRVINYLVLELGIPLTLVVPDWQEVNVKRIA